MPANFQIIAAHPALDFVNTLDDRFSATGPIELLRSYADLLLFVEQAEVLNARTIGVLRKRSDSPPAARALRAAQELREALAAVFYEASEGRKPPAAALKRLERHFIEALKHQELVWQRPANGEDSDVRAMWEWGGFTTDLMLPVWAIARSAAALVTSAAVDHVHACNSPTCRWLFLDTSKNHSRRWCDMKICGNRVKARRFQAKH